MKPIYQRIVAIVILCLPGVAGIYGWTEIREVIFYSAAGEGFGWLRFLWGLLLLVGSLYIIGGFIFYRDKKNNRISPKFLTPEERAERERQKQDPNYKKPEFLDKV
ncbi:hypothetical protein J2Z48_001500 [Croceifilum oryzae]|uniref:DUF2627 domain-containing protein n=1 Tax=Croceifilum oryzae TaxID=1553429 RepID=A0AAJ1WQ99_9BACL|nr:DUF2627 family protein [Croceifilum oryzae]MDQ0417327.1 hypothetical protein [Croceifilum oryzae]